MRVISTRLLREPSTCLLPILQHQFQQQLAARVTQAQVTVISTRLLREPSTCLLPILQHQFQQQLATRVTQAQVTVISTRLLREPSTGLLPILQHQLQQQLATRVLLLCHQRPCSFLSWAQLLLGGEARAVRREAFMHGLATLT